MQTLFARVAQVRGACRCPQCVSSVNGITRRATASATRRLPRYITSSTLWYSGIFATAATFDASAKQQRREKWDKAIAQVKEELAESGQERQTQDEEAKAEMEVWVQDHVGDEEEESMQFKPFADGSGDADGFVYTDGQTKAEWPANTGEPLYTKHLAPNSIYAEDWQRTRAEMNRWTPKKLALVQTSMDILLLELIRELQNCGESVAAAEAMPAAYRPLLLQDRDKLHTKICDKHYRMRVLRRAHVDMTYYTLAEAPEEELPIPADDNPVANYHEDQENRFRAKQRDLNASLSHLFGQYAKEEIDRPGLLGQITYHLLSSHAPPNLNTFNILLLGFSRADEHWLFRHACSGLRRCHMRPNEITLATVLNHFTKLDRPKLFAYWIRLIRGKDNGLANARPDVNISKESQARLMRNPERPERIIQLPYHTPIVFGAITAGVLKFAGFDAALQICQGMGREGWGLCMAGLTPLLHDCVRRADWTSGEAVWKQIQALKNKSKRREGGRWLSERIRLETYAVMLRLCRKCDRRDVFSVVWDAALTSHKGGMERLRGLVRGRMKGGDVVEESIVAAAREEEARVEKARTEAMSFWEFAELDTPDATDLELVMKGDDNAGQRSGDTAADEADSVREEATLSQEMDGTAGPERDADEMRGQPLTHTSVSSHDRDPKTEKTMGWPGPAPQLRDGELHGLLPSSSELDEYELRERPMHLRA